MRSITFWLDEHRALWSCLIAGLCIRVLFVVLVLPWLNQKLSLGYGTYDYDADGYGRIAGSMLQGQYTDVQRAPLYPAFIAAAYALFHHSNLAVKIGQCLLDTGTVALVWGLGRRACPGSRIGLGAAFLYAAYPLAWWRCGFVDKEILETFALALFAWSLGAVGAMRSFGSGLLLGAANLTKPILLGLPLVVGLWIWTQRDHLPRPGVQFLAMLLGMLALITPWTVRNYLVTKEFVPVALENGGMTAFVGNYPPSLGAWEGPHKAQWQTAIADLTKEHPKASFVELDRIYMRAAIAEVLEHPTAVPHMVLLKLLRFWFSSPSGRLDAPIVAVQSALLLLGTWGLVRRRLLSQSATLFALLIAYLWVVHGLIYAEVRFSLPAMPYVMVFAAVPLFRGAASAKC